MKYLWFLWVLSLLSNLGLGQNKRLIIIDLFSVEYSEALVDHVEEVRSPGNDLLCSIGPQGLKIYSGARSLESLEMDLQGIHKSTVASQIMLKSLRQACDTIGIVLNPEFMDLYYFMSASDYQVFSQSVNEFNEQSFFQDLLLCLGPLKPSAEPKVFIQLDNSKKDQSLNLTNTKPGHAVQPIFY